MLDVPVLLGCLASGEVIVKSYRIACYGATIAGAIAFATFILEWRRGRLAWWPFYGALAAVHPGWPMWNSFISGVLAVSSDCGYSDRFVSAGVCVALATLFLCLVVRPDFSRRMFLLTFAVACCQLYLAAKAFWLGAISFDAIAKILGEEATIAASFGASSLLIPAVVSTLLFLAVASIASGRAGGYRYTMIAAAVLTVFYAVTAYNVTWPWMTLFAVAAVILAFESVSRVVFRRCANAV